jgi:uncharacterized membrane protein YphA (DoxX/SURF4 family)
MRVAISPWAAALLVLLRLTIGWHFFWEGYHKWHEHQVGPTETVVGKKVPFSSAGYFREAPGPLAKVLRGRTGDPEADALGRLEVQPIPAGQDPATYPPHKRVPLLLHEEWSDYVERFARHYGFSEQQKTEANTKLEQAENGVVTWLTKPEVDDKTKAIKKSFQSASWDVKQPVADRVAEYKRKLADLRDTADNKLWLMGRDVEGKRLGQAKADLAALRASLLADLDEEHTKNLQQALDGILTPEQKKDAEPLPATEPPRTLTWINTLTIYGLMAMGAGLLLGLFTRTFCVLAAGFLLMTYLCAPPFPWLPTPPNSEGYYLFVNKNVVEMVALLALAATASGRWFGLDALLHEIWLTIRRRPRATAA